MKLGEKQELFAESHCKLLSHAFGLGLRVRQRELQRTPEMAALYVERGVGVANSTHIYSLAIDLYLTRDGTLMWRGPDYDALGAYWKSLSVPGANHCWGGDFSKPYDPYHFSIEHNGVK